MQGDGIEFSISIDPVWTAHVRTDGERDWERRVDDGRATTAWSAAGDVVRPMGNFLPVCPTAPCRVQSKRQNGTGHVGLGLGVVGCQAAAAVRSSSERSRVSNGILIAAIYQTLSASSRPLLPPLYPLRQPVHDRGPLHSTVEYNYSFFGRRALSIVERGFSGISSQLSFSVINSELRPYRPCDRGPLKSGSMPRSPSWSGLSTDRLAAVLPSTTVG